MDGRRAKANVGKCSRWGHTPRDDIASEDEGAEWSSDVFGESEGAQGRTFESDTRRERRDGCNRRNRGWRKSEEGWEVKTSEGKSGGMISLSVEKEGEGCT